METAAKQAAMNLRPITKDKARTELLIDLLRQIGALYDSIIPDADNPLLHEETEEDTRPKKPRAARPKVSATSTKTARSKA